MQEVQKLSNNLKIPIARIGIWEHPLYRYVAFTQKDFDDIKHNFKERSWGFDPYLRYGHARYEGASDGEPATAFMRDIQQEGDVLFGIFDPVDENVVREIKEGRYRYASAEVTRNAPGKRLGGPKNIGSILTAVALTNAPFVPDLPENQVLSSNPSDEHFFVLNQKETSMPEENDKTILQQLSQGVSQILDFLKGSALTKGEGEARHGEGMDNLGGAPAMPELPIAQVFSTFKKAEDEEDEAHSQRLSQVYEQMFSVYAAAGKEEQFSQDWEQVCSTASGLGEDFAPVAQVFTASPATSTPVYKNGKLVKGRPNQDGGSGTKVGIPSQHLSQTQDQVQEESLKKDVAEDQKCSQGESSSELNGTADNAGAEVQEQTLTASPAAPSAVYENGEKVKGQDDSQHLSANGGLATEYRPMPPYNPLGPTAFAVQALSQCAAKAAEAEQTKSEQLSQSAAGNQPASHQEGTNMPEVNEQFQEQLQAMEQKLSQALATFETEKAALVEKNKKLEEQLSTANGQLTNLTSAASQAAMETAELKLSQRAATMKSEGIPPVLVDEAVKTIREAGFQQKLSMGGAEASLEDTLLGLLSKLPAENRVDLSQVGAKQNLSQNAAQDNETFVYEGVIKERMGE